MSATGSIPKSILAELASGETPAYRSAESVGMKGTIIPSADMIGMGGSTGFNSQTLLPINVDPDQPTGYVLQPHQVKQNASEGLSPMIGYDKQEVRNFVSEKMRKAAAAAVSIESPPVQEKPMAVPELPKRQRKQRVQKALDVAPPVAHPTVTYPQTELSLAPTVKITFDFGPPYGEVETFYHGIFKEGNNLVLAWDTNCKTATRYKPSVSDKLIHVIVGGEDFMVMNLGVGFTDTDTGMQYSVLMIDMRK